MNLEEILYKYLYGLGKAEVDKRIVKYMDGEALNISDDFSSTALINAVEANDIEATKILVDAGVEIDAKGC